MEKYYTRYIEPIIERKLKSSGCVVVVGPKYCGKTTTSMLFAKSSIKLISDQAISLARIDPESVLNGEKPRLVDEWQTVPDLWNLVRARVDEGGGFGQYIFTGSATPVDKTKLHHSGAGRITRVMMRTMSMYESLESTGQVSIEQLLDDPTISIWDMNEGYSLKDTAFYICRGGWPQSLIEDREVALEVTRNYYNGLLNFETSDNATFRNKRPETLKTVLRSFARNISAEATAQTMMADIRAADNRTMDPKTFEEYADVLRDLFIIEDMNAWNTNLRSKTVIRTTPTRHFVDTSIAACALNIYPNDLINDLNTFGLFFEDMAVRDLRVYAMRLGAEVYHYRDSRKYEIDAVMHFPDGRFGLIEIKLGGEQRIAEGAESINKVSQDLRQAPTFKMILTATGPAYRRPDGILVVPINKLKA